MCDCCIVKAFINAEGEMCLFVVVGILSALESLAVLEILIRSLKSLKSELFFIAGITVPP